MGVPFYAQPENPKSKQISYDTIIENNPINAESDTVILNGKTYYYNGEETIKKKTKLALDQGLGGMMMWELGQDAEGPYSLTQAISEVFQSENQYVSEHRMNNFKNSKTQSSTLLSFWGFAFF